MSIRSRSVAAVCLVLCLCLARLSAAGVLYDGTLGTMPASQGWLYLTDPLGASATQSLDTGVTVLDTTPATSDSAGYFSTVHPGVGVLDRGAGYRVGFDVEIVSENHPSTNRAGFSVIEKVAGLAMVGFVFEYATTFGDHFAKPLCLQQPFSEREIVFDLTILQTLTRAFGFLED